jgi:hypothetical protein
VNHQLQTFLAVIDFPNYVLSNGFSKDDHIADLLLFSPQIQFHNDRSYKSGKIILQDKASCFPAVILAPPATNDSVVIGKLSPHLCRLRLIECELKTLLLLLVTRRLI